MAISKWDRQHVKNIDRLTKEIDKIYNTAIQRIAIIASSIRKEQLTDNIFKFSDHPITTEVVESVRNMMARELETAIVNGVRSEWTLSNNKNNEMCNMVFGGSQAVENKGYLRKYYNNNEDALVQFIQRKEAGMDLSSRVWNFVDKYQTELELALDNGIRQGMSAADMTKDLKECLKYPDKVFRRVRDEHGDLVLSKEAKAFHPGQGVYRSSYMNARRLAATETNMAYRTADYVRWQQLDFVVGIEIGLSNNHTCKGYKGKTPWMDICDELQGKYPKDFKWTGWHPHCRCHATPIMKTIAEMKADDERVMRGEEPSKDSVNSVNEMPKQFNDWLIDNQERIDRAKSKPYFIKDNKSIINRQMVAVLKPYKMSVEDAQKIINSGYSIHLNTNKLTAENLANEYNSSQMSGIDIFKYETPVLKIIEKCGEKVSRKEISFTKGEVSVSYIGNKEFALYRTFSKLYDNNVAVVHEQFEIAKKYQDKGFAKKLLKAHIKEYQRAGISEISLKANIDVGGYAWARYNFSTPGYYIEQLVNKWERLFRTKAININKEELNQAIDIVNEFYKNHNKTTPFKMRLLTGYDWSKRLLLKECWPGEINMYDQDALNVLKEYIGF